MKILKKILFIYCIIFGINLENTNRITNKNHIKNKKQINVKTLNIIENNTNTDNNIILNTLDNEDFDELLNNNKKLNQNETKRISTIRDFNISDNILEYNNTSEVNISKITNKKNKKIKSILNKKINVKNSILKKIGLNDILYKKRVSFDPSFNKECTEYKKTISIYKNILNFNKNNINKHIQDLDQLKIYNMIHNNEPQKMSMEQILDEIKKSKQIKYYENMRKKKNLNTNIFNTNIKEKQEKNTDIDHIFTNISNDFKFVENKKRLNINKKKCIIISASIFSFLFFLYILLSRVFNIF